MNGEMHSGVFERTLSVCPELFVTAVAEIRGGTTEVGQRGHQIPVSQMPGHLQKVITTLLCMSSQDGN